MCQLWKLSLINVSLEQFKKFNKKRDRIEYVET